MHHQDVKGATSTVIEAMTEVLAENGRVEVRGFGTFSVRQRNPRVARNPKSNEKVSVGERKAVYFRPGKLLKARVNR